MHRKFALVALLTLTPALAHAQGGVLTDCTPYAAQERTLAIGDKNVRYYSSHSLSSFPNPNIRRAVFLVHGLSGDVCSYWGALLASAQRAKNTGLAPNVLTDTILIAPNFRSTHDLDRPSGYHYWNGDHWIQGSQSTAGVSSYAVMDALVGKLTSSVRVTRISPLERRFPNLEMIVVAGHSSGGQLAHRYAATNEVEGDVPGVQMRYVVSAPSSYLYLDEFRPYSDYSSGVGDPYRFVNTYPITGYERNPGFSNAPWCPLDYNDWKFGLEDLNLYSSEVGAPLIRLRLLTRRVTVLIGTDDTTTQSLDQDCEAQIQGANRYERAHRYLEYLDIRFPNIHEHTLVEVPGAGHPQSETFPGDSFSTGPAALFVD